MPNGLRRLIKSSSNGLLLEAAAEFVRANSETLVLVPAQSAGEELAHRTLGILGLHRLTVVQFAAALARPRMADSGLAPLTLLGLQAIAARVVYASRSENELRYFAPVAALPGFVRAVARTLGELRLAGTDPGVLANTGAPGADLARLLTRYEAELEERSLADLATVLELATQAVVDGAHRWRD